MAKSQHPKIYLSKGICVPCPPGKGTSMPIITNQKNNLPPKKESNINEDKLLEMAKVMAKEMAAEISKSIQTTVVHQATPESAQAKEDSLIELEAGFIDPSESENFSVNLDNVETKSGGSIQDKLAKLKKLKEEG